VTGETTKTLSDAIWVRLDETPLAIAIRQSLVERYGELVVLEAELPQGATVGLVIADDAHGGEIGRAADHNAGALQSILITDDPTTGTRADFVLHSDVDLESVMSVVRSTKDFRDQVMSLRADVARRKSAIGTIINGQFVFRTLDEARNLATMVALACPNSDLVAVGLQELLINAVEHGNLEIDAALKHDLLLEGCWREEVEARLGNPAFAHRVVIFSFKRSDRIISMTIQDEGDGFDHVRYLADMRPMDGYRGRGIAMAKDLAFSSLTYLGAGNIVEATILLPKDGRG